MERFVNRGDELAQLKSCYESDDAELIVVYGRRRLGKSELVRRSIADHDDAVYYQAIESTAENQLEQFMDAVTARFPHFGQFWQHWETQLDALSDQDGVVIIDEVPFLTKEHDSLLSRIQEIWDMSLKHTSMTLVLVGSDISVIEDNILSGGSPLSSSCTATIDLQPLSVTDATTFFPEYDAETVVTTWAIYGGAPFYLQTIDPEQSLRTNIQQSILSEQGVLHSEPEFFLHTELRQPSTYFSILRAIAHGRETPTEIASMAGVESQSLSTYLQKLQHMRLVERHIPVTASATSSKRGRYRFAIPLFRFWFRFVYDNRAQLRSLGEDAFDEIVRPELTDYVSPLFKQLCQQSLPDLVDQQFRDVGGWWFKEHELDVLGLTDAGLVAGECMFTSSPMSEGVLSDLERTTQKVQWAQEPADGDTQFVLFSRSGFTTDLKQQAQSRADVTLCPISDIIGV